MKQVQATSARPAVSLMVSLCGLLYLQVSLELLLVVRGFNGLKDLLAQLASPEAGGSSSPFFLADDQEVFFGNFHACQICNLKRFR